MQDFRKLDVWRLAYALAKSIYEHTKRFPRDERYEMTRQVRRAAFSITLNIAEGCGRRKTGARWVTSEN